VVAFQNDTTLSSAETVIGNIYANFTMAAMRSVNYLVDVGYLAQGNLNLIISMSLDSISQQALHICLTPRLQRLYTKRSLKPVVPTELM
jgi:hypothetical protein